MTLAGMLLAVPEAGDAAPAGFIVDPTSNCGTSNPFPRPGESIRWQGGCRDGKLQGRGVLTWYESNKEYERNDGVFADGELEGEAIVSFANGNRIYGNYRRGIRDGEFTVVRPDGKRIRATYQNGAFVTERLLRAEEAAAFEADRQRLEQRLGGVASTASGPPAATPSPAAPAPVAATRAADSPPGATPSPRPLAAPPAPAAPPLPAAVAPSIRLPAAAVPPATAAQPAIRAGAAARRAEPPIRLRPPPELASAWTTADYGPETLVIDSRSARDFPRQAGMLRLPLGGPPSAPPETAAQRPTVPAAQSGLRYAVRIVDWPVAEAAALLFGTVIQRPYRIDPAVSGRISITPAQPVDGPEATAALAEALRPLGAELLSTAEALAIVPAGRRQR